MKCSLSAPEIGMVSKINQLAALEALIATSTPFPSAPPAFPTEIPAAQARAPPPAQAGPSTSAQFVTKEEFDEKRSFKTPKEVGRIQPYRSPYILHIMKPCSLSSRVPNPTIFYLWW